jgi:cytochrome c peroxidase
MNRVILVAGAVWLAACSQAPKQEAKQAAPAKPIGQVVEIKAPLGLPPVPIPADNPPTAETIALGRKLYYEKRFSVDSTISCASCHDPEKGFADGKPFSDGVKGGRGDRSAPTVANAAYYTLQFWDGRAPSLEAQAEGPIQNPIEMGHTHEGCVASLQSDPEYVALFEKAFGPGPISMDMVTKAVASFERTVISGNSPFDRYQYGGDRKAMSAQAIRGLEVFKNPAKGNCAVCHTIGDKYALFTDNLFHNLGVGMNSKGELTDLGRFKETGKEADKGAFKTPTLRNIALTAPYMHDGSHKTLKDVVDFYIGGGNGNPNLDKEIKPLKLSRQERDDLVAFLEALTGEMPPNVDDPNKKVARAGGAGR